MLNILIWNQKPKIENEKPKNIMMDDGSAPPLTSIFFSKHGFPTP